MNTLIDPIEIDIIPENDQEAEEGIDLETDLLLKSLKKCLIFSKQIMNKYNIVEMKAKANTINMTTLTDIETGIEMIVKSDITENTAETDITEMTVMKDTTNQDMAVKKDIINMKDKIDITEKDITEMTVRIAMTAMIDMKDLADQTIITEIEVKIDIEEMIVMTDIDLTETEIEVPGNNMVETTAMKDIQKEIIKTSVSSVIMMHYTAISYKG